MQNLRVAVAAELLDFHLSVISLVDSLYERRLVEGACDVMSPQFHQSFYTLSIESKQNPGSR